MIQLRPYQARFIQACRAHVNAGRTRILGVAPTGAGKAVIAAAMIQSSRRNFNARSLFIVHRLELVDQQVRQLSALGVNKIGVIRADDARTDDRAPVQVATTQTLARRELPPADLVFSDEAHHDSALSRQAILDAYPDATVIGFTATPWRLDGSKLWRYQVIEPIASYSELIAQAWLANPIVYASPAPVDLTQVRMAGGDYNMDDAEPVMSGVVGNLVREWQAHAEGRRTLVFACTIKHSQQIVRAFMDAGIRAEHVDGSTPEESRRAAWRRLDDGLCQVVSNVGIATEGFDLPSVKCIALARPTKSLSLLIQMSGRSMRLWNNVRPIILDHGCNVEEHGFPHSDRIWSLEGRPKLARPVTGFRVCPKCYAYVAKNPCELCGFLQPTQERRIRADGSVELVELKIEDERRSAFVRYVKKARAYGYKPGYASAQYKERFGEWPPRTWGMEASQEYARDASWQERLADRTKKRDWWQGQQEGGLEVEVPDTKPEPRTVGAAKPEEQEGLWYDDQEIPF